MTRLIFVRHGESESNVAKYFTGHLNVKLTDKGRAQAACTAKALESMQIDAAYASDLIRAYETGEIIARGHGLTVTPEAGLREIYAGKWEGRFFTELDDLFHEDYQAWRNDMANCRCTGGESVREMAVRVKEACERIARAEDGKTVLIATHATPIRVLLTGFMGRPIEEAAGTPWVSNASVTKLEYENGEFRIAYSDRHDHLGDLSTRLPANV